MDRMDLYRLLVADQLDLLEPEEKRRLERALSEYPDVDRLRFAERVVAALGDAGDAARERQFLDALQAAENEGGEPIPSIASPAKRFRARRSLGRWGLGLAAAAGAAAVWLGDQFGSEPSRSGPAATLPPAADSRGEAPSRASQAVLLDANRAEGDEIDLDATSAPYVTFVTEARIQATTVIWQLRDGGDVVLETGRLEFASEGSALRSIALQVAKERLSGSLFWLILQDTSGRELRRWSIRVQ